MNSKDESAMVNGFVAGSLALLLVLAVGLFVQAERQNNRCMDFVAAATDLLDLNIEQGMAVNTLLYASEEEGFERWLKADGFVRQARDLHEKEPERKKMRDRFIDTARACQGLEPLGDPGGQA